MRIHKGKSIFIAMNSVDSYMVEQIDSVIE